MYAVGIRLNVAPQVGSAARQRFVDYLRELFVECRFRTLSELGKALQPPRSKTWLSDLCRGNQLPDDHELRLVVLACKPSAWPAAHELLIAARAEASAQAAAVPTQFADHAAASSRAGWPIVSDFDDWETLGVHRPITHMRSGQDLSVRLIEIGLPAYVLRESDLAPGGLRARIGAAAAEKRARLIVICGDAAAGKTRTALEAMRSILPAWRLLAPYGANSLLSILDGHPNLRHVVVWLDEIQDYLREPNGLVAVRRLLGNLDGPTILLGTVRTDREEVLRGTPGWDLLDRQADRIVLRRRPPGPEFEGELARARQLDGDPWIADALSSIGDRYGIGEWLAAGPQLLRELERARTSPPRSVARLSAAIVDAAVDFDRIGYNALIPVDALREACRLYVDVADVSWTDGVFEAAVERVQEPVSGAVGLCTMKNGVGIRADSYLVNVAAHEGRTPRDGLWEIILENSNSLDTVAVLAHLAGELSISAAATEQLEEHVQRVIYSITRNHAALSRRVEEGSLEALLMQGLTYLADKDIDGILSLLSESDFSRAMIVSQYLIELEAKDALLGVLDRFATFPTGEVYHFLFFIVGRFLLDRDDLEDLDRIRVRYPQAEVWLPRLT